jgi:hypothetical protein
MNDAGVITVPLGPQIEPRTISLAIKTGDKALPAARAFVEAAVEAAENVLL